MVCGGLASASRTICGGGGCLADCHQARPFVVCRQAVMGVGVSSPGVGVVSVGGLAVESPVHAAGSGVAVFGVSVEHDGLLRLVVPVAEGGGAAAVEADGVGGAGGVEELLHVGAVGAVAPAGLSAVDGEEEEEFLVFGVAGGHAWVDGAVVACRVCPCRCG